MDTPLLVDQDKQTFRRSRVSIQQGRYTKGLGTRGLVGYRKLDGDAGGMLCLVHAKALGLYIPPAIGLGQPTNHSRISSVIKRSMRYHPGASSLSATKLSLQH